MIYARLQLVIDGAIAAIAKQLADRKAASFVRGDSSLVSEQSGRQRRRMRCNARSEVERDSIEMISGAGRANRTAFLQASKMRIAEVPASRSLGQVSAQRPDAADLWRG
jgi:hypothetical protein